MQNNFVIPFLFNKIKSEKKNLYVIEICFKSYWKCDKEKDEVF